MVGRELVVFQDELNGRLGVSRAGRGGEEQEGEREARQGGVTPEALVG